VNPYHHAVSSAKLHGGRAEDYLQLHQWFDESKAFFPDFRHRALRHHAEGIFLAERIFGPTLTNSAGRIVPVRVLSEQHVKEDLGRIPTVQDWLECLAPQSWMIRSGKVEACQPKSSSSRPPEEPVIDLNELCKSPRDSEGGADSGEKDNDEPARFRNHYQCPKCGGSWSDDWSAACDDDCPHCGERHVPPVESEDLPAERQEAPADSRPSHTPCAGPDQLTKDQLAAIVRALQEHMFLDLDAREGDFWNPDKQVSPSDLYEHVYGLLEQHGVCPSEELLLRERQRATILAALRHWQNGPGNDINQARAEFGQFDNLQPLTADQIDDLCEQINQADQLWPLDTSEPALP